jgi:hypothetical protein
LVFGGADHWQQAHECRQRHAEPALRISNQDDVQDTSIYSNPSTPTLETIGLGQQPPERLQPCGTYHQESQGSDSWMWYERLH